MALGCGATLGGYISGKLGDIFDSKKTGTLGIIMFLMGCVLAIATL